MKKSFLVLSIAALLSLASCASPSPTPTSPSGSDSASVTEKPSVAEKYAVVLPMTPEGYTITSSHAEAEAGVEVTLTIEVQQPGLALDKVKMNDVELTVEENTAKFVMPSKDATISVETVEILYKINLPKDPEGYSVTSSLAEAKYNQDVTLTIDVTKIGAKISAVKMNDENLFFVGNSLTFKMPSCDANISVELIDIKYNVKLPAEQVGYTLTSSLAEAKYNETVTLTLDVTDNLKLLDEVKINGNVTSMTTANTLVFTMPAEDVIVDVKLKDKTFKVNLPSNVEGYTIETDKTEAKKGELVTLTIHVIDETKMLKQVKINGEVKEMTTASTLQFEMPAKTVVVEVTLASVTADIIVNEVEGLTITLDSKEDIAVGEKVKVNVKNDATHLIDEVVATADGQVLELTRTSYYDFTFVMPNKDVTISATTLVAPLANPTFDGYSFEGSTPFEYDDYLGDYVGGDYFVLTFEDGCANLAINPNDTNKEWTDVKYHYIEETKTVYLLHKFDNYSDKGLNTLTYDEAKHELTMNFSPSSYYESKDLVLKRQARSYNVTKQYDEHVRVNGIRDTAKEGATISLSLIVDDHYMAHNVKVTEVISGNVVPFTSEDLNTQKYKFVMPSADINISFDVMILDLPYTITTDLNNATIDLDNLNNVYEGDEVNFTLTPEEGYVIDEVNVKTTEGVVVELLELASGYQFTMPMSDVTISNTASLVVADEFLASRTFEGDIKVYPDYESPYDAGNSATTISFNELGNGASVTMATVYPSDPTSWNLFSGFTKNATVTKNADKYVLAIEGKFTLTFEKFDENTLMFSDISSNNQTHNSVDARKCKLVAPAKPTGNSISGKRFEGELGLFDYSNGDVYDTDAIVYDKRRCYKIVIKNRGLYLRSITINGINIKFR